MDTDTEFLARRRLWIINSVGAVVLVFVFILMVMTAIAQQEVLSRITTEQLRIGYGEARGIREEALRAEVELKRLTADQKKHLKAFRTAQMSWRQTGRVFDDAWENFAPYLERINGAKVCDIAVPSDNNMAARARALNDYQECLASHTGARVVTAAKPAAGQLSAALNKHRESNLAYRESEDRLTDARAEMDESKLPDVQAKVLQIFKDMDVLLSGWLMLGGGLVAVPPAMLQILLTFVSGLFGAVLITFVLLVYPKSVVDVTDTQQTWARIFLGGLIALCVYIILLGGAAILGTNSGIIAAGTNYMAFCGIGILAGMFSDRAAAWLSERADVFFKRGRAGGPPSGSGGTNNG